MSKPKALIKQSKSKKRKDQAPETADEFLAVGVESEEAAGKWRAGDAVKSLRFFGRAVETYDQGLRRFPRSLDLAYNKARVQLEIVTHPLLLKKLEVPILDGLQQALMSHRYALSLDQDNADTLFNTAQVLTAIAEELAKDDGDAIGEQIRLLEEALELQGRCLSIQEMRLEESERQQQEFQQTTPQEPVRSTTEPTEQDNDVDAVEDQWFSVIEPITADTLIDTALAQIGTLTTLCSILSSSITPTASPSLPWIEEFSSSLLNSKLSFYSQASPLPRLQEIALAKANFISAFLEASFHQRMIDSATFKKERDNVFQVPELMLEQYPDGLIANAKSLMAFASALSDETSVPPDLHAPLIWQSLSTAVTNLSTASKIQGIEKESLTETHLFRGGFSLLLWQLSQPPISFQNALDNSKQLLQNAEVFFRNASKLSQDEDVRAVAGFRSSVAQLLRGSDSGEATSMLSSHGKGPDWEQAQITDMIDEGLLPPNFHELIRR